MKQNKIKERERKKIKLSCSQYKVYIDCIKKRGVGGSRRGKVEIEYDCEKREKTKVL